MSIVVNFQSLLPLITEIGFNRLSGKNVKYLDAQRSFVAFEGKNSSAKIRDNTIMEHWQK